MIGGTRTGPRTHQERDFVYFNHEWSVHVLFNQHLNLRALQWKTIVQCQSVAQN